MLDTHKPTYDIVLSLSPAKVSKEAEPTDVEVTGRLDGATVNDETLSFLLRDMNTGTAGRDADYDLDVNTLTIARKKPNGIRRLKSFPRTLAMVPSG